MKKIVFVNLFLLGTIAFAQVAIGKSTITNSSVSLEFGNGNKGIILPWVDSVSAVTGAVNGTMVYDLTDHKVKIKYTNGWKDLSVDNTGTTVDPVSGIDGTVIQNSAIENPKARVSIGTVSSNAGILVLEDTNKAMILPIVASPHLNIVNPAPGMMVYDIVSKQLAVFNGKVWSFWK